LQERIALSLATLPAPKNKYELVGGESIASTEEDELVALLEADAAGAGRGGSSAHIADAGELEARRIAAEAAAAAAELRTPLAALRHLPPLPRPLVVNEEALAPPLGAAAAVDPSATADALIRVMKWWFCFHMMHLSTRCVSKMQSTQLVVERGSKHVNAHVFTDCAQGLQSA